MPNDRPLSDCQRERIIVPSQDAGTAPKGHDMRAQGNALEYGSELGPRLAYIAPKGHNTEAQGNALGRGRR